MPRPGKGPQTELGRALRDLRGEQRYSTRALAESAGLSHGYVAALEYGIDRRTGKTIRPNPDVLRRLAAVLGEGSYERLLAAAGYAAPPESGADSPDAVERMLLRFWREMDPAAREWLLIAAETFAQRAIVARVARAEGRPLTPASRAG